MSAEAGEGKAIFFYVEEEGGALGTSVHYI